jgi:hypothetical protein
MLYQIRLISSVSEPDQAMNLSAANGEGTTLLFLSNIYTAVLFVPQGDEIDPDQLT